MAADAYRALAATPEKTSLFGGRAGRFLDLSRDLLCTVDPNGRLAELNSAWADVLGYGGEELRSTPLLDLVHPDDHERTEAEAARVRPGEGAVVFENRCRAKDGSWHWLRWSAALAAGESLVYARATDIAELKRLESERERLLTEVAVLARSDALTGLANRRGLEQQLPREMARVRRTGSDLCLALVDIDRFKAFNDLNGYQAGDVLLRECAVAWDAQLRGEDTIVRYGGGEFLIVLPDCPLERAVEIVERLRAATPGEETCSAGLAGWDQAESIDDLLDRADSALYRAKAAGRDRLVQAPRIES